MVLCEFAVVFCSFVYLSIVVCSVVCAWFCHLCVVCWVLAVVCVCVVFASLVYPCVEGMLLLGLMCTGTPELRVFDLVRMVSPADALCIKQDYARL